MTAKLTMVDLFCGAGGADLGTHLALKELGITAGDVRALAVNHWQLAVSVHGLNLPWISVKQEDIEKVSAKTFRLREIDLLWASPSCVHHSRARGGKPSSDQQRSHAWEVLERWIEKSRVKVFLMENVPEFLDYGPLHRDTQQPIKARKGEYFRAFVRRLRALGYTVDWRVLCAADYGDPTTRRRLFLQAVCGGREIAWPEPTHRDPRKPAKPGQEGLPTWRAAASCIDWDIPCPSIFDRKRQLAEATMRRIATGVVRFVLQGKPFLVTCNHTDPSFRGQGIDEPMKTVTAAHDARGVVRGTEPSHIASSARSVGDPLRTVSAAGSHHAVVTPFVAGVGGRMGQSPERHLARPFQTVTTKADAGLVAPVLIQTSYGERKGQSPRVLDLQQPLTTVVAGGVKHGLAAAHLTKFQQNSKGQSPEDPLHTVMAGAQRFGVSAAFLAKGYGGPGAIEKQPPGLHPTQPMGTVTAQDKHELVTVGLGPEVTARARQVAAFILKFYKNSTGQTPGLPLHTITTIARLGLVTVEIDGQTHVITDIGLRMLRRHELARAQGFPDWFRWEYPDGTPLTERDSVKLIGNACPVGTVRALIKAVVLRRPQAFGLEVAA